MTCAPSKKSDQPGHLHAYIQYVMSYPLSTKLCIFSLANFLVIFGGKELTQVVCSFTALEAGTEWQQNVNEHTVTLACNLVTIFVMIIAP